jgi:hypothetical protein
MAGNPKQGKPRGDGLSRDRRKVIAERQALPRPEEAPRPPRRPRTEHFHEMPPGAK